MGNSVSDYFTDEELEMNLRSFFDDKEAWNINFKVLFKRIEDFNDMYFSLKIKDRIFYINKFSGEIMEKE